VLLFSHVGDPCDCSFKLIQLTIGRARFLANVNTTLLEPPTFGIVNFDQYPNENCSWEWNNCDFSNFKKTERALIDPLGIRPLDQLGDEHT
jgi:hypothetical protein